MRRSSGHIVVAAALAAALALVPAPIAEASSDSTSAKTLYTQSNAERSKRDLPALKRNSGLDRVASAWAKKMASTANGKCAIGSKGLRHNPSLKSQAPKGWKKVGENVGCGYTTSGAGGMVNAWMQSSGHRANILSTGFTDIGVGYYTDAEGMTWGVQVFAQYPKSAGSAPKTKPKSKPKAKAKAEPKASSAPEAAPKTAPQSLQSLTPLGSASAALFELRARLVQERFMLLIAALSGPQTNRLLQSAPLAQAECSQPAAPPCTS